MKKFLFMICAVFVLSISAFATSYDFAPSPFTEVDPNGTTNLTYSQTDDNQPVYFYLMKNPNDSNNVWIYAISEYRSSFLTSGINSYGSTINRTSTLTDSYGGYYHFGMSPYYSNYNYNVSLNVFDYQNNYINVNTAFANYLSNPPVVDSVTSSFIVPRGNVLYFKVAVESDVTFISEFNRLSNIVTIGGGNPWGDTGAAYGPAAALPTADTKFPIASMDNVVWQKYGSTNVLGQTKTGSVTKHCVVGQWYALYNPSFAYISEQMRDAVGGTITASGSFSQIKIYPLNQELSFENGISGFNSDSTDGYASYYDGAIDSETGDVTFTNQDGVISEPVNGGQNYQEPAISAVGLVEQVKQTLANILTEIENLFTFGYSAIGSLVGLMSQFVNSLGQLYSWLPSEVYSAIMSAVIVAIVIGVFKVFL